MSFGDFHISCKEKGKTLMTVPNKGKTAWLHRKFYISRRKTCQIGESNHCSVLTKYNKWNTLSHQLLMAEWMCIFNTVFYILMNVTIYDCSSKAAGYTFILLTLDLAK